MALLALMCGFLAGTIINATVDAATGYATTDIGPKWRQRTPLPINRWQTLVTKWAMALPVTGLLTGLMLVVAVGALDMNAPNAGLLWLFTWLAAASVAAGTLVLFAALGSQGQLIALLLFVYLGLASAGGTVPIQALPSPLKLVSQIEPLRQILAGTRSILYFNAGGSAGLTRGLITATAGLIFWLALGTVIVKWYDRKGFHRIQPRPARPRAQIRQRVPGRVATTTALERGRRARTVIGRLRGSGSCAGYTQRTVAATRVAR